MSLQTNLQIILLYLFLFEILSLIFTVIVHDALLMAKVECFWGK